jgi:two-component system response regulator EvgA
VIVDDHPSFRQAARALLEARGHVVVGEAACGAAAQELIARLLPDVVLLDVRLGDECGLEIASALTKEYPRLRVLLVSSECELDPRRVRESGACGFMHKSRLGRLGADPFGQ